ncbi:MAG: hypothetical protein ABR607_09510 [Pyrinomonadaceae bacterium]
MPRPALIIEDDPDIAESVRYNLKGAGFKTLVAATGEQGLSLALENRMAVKLSSDPNLGKGQIL